MAKSKLLQKLECKMMFQVIHKKAENNRKERNEINSIGTNSPQNKDAPISIMDNFKFNEEKVEEKNQKPEENGVGLINT